MRVLGVVLMALLSSQALAGQPAPSAQKPSGLVTKAPSSNPIDKALEDAFNGERSGKLTHEQAMRLFTDAYMNATPEQRRQHDAGYESAPDIRGGGQ